MFVLSRAYVCKKTSASIGNKRLFPPPPNFSSSATGYKWKKSLCEKNYYYPISFTSLFFS